MSISPISANPLPLTPSGGNTTGPQSAVDQLGKTFSQALDSLNTQQLSSDQLIQQLAAGENVDVHNVMIAAEQTDVAFRIAIAMRDQLVTAYQEMMRMQI
jgi:flagellar hook-basal body complex protein FliE